MTEFLTAFVLFFFCIIRLSETEEDECKSLLIPHGFVMIRIKEIPNAQER